MRLDVQVGGKTTAQLYRERDEYVLKYLPGTDPADFVSLTMPVREEPWRWPRDLHPFFRQNLPEGYLLGIIREEFGPLLDGTDLSLLAVVGGAWVLDGSRSRPKAARRGSIWNRCRSSVC